MIAALELGSCARCMSQNLNGNRRLPRIFSDAGTDFARARVAMPLSHLGPMLEPGCARDGMNYTSADAQCGTDTTQTQTGTGTGGDSDSRVRAQCPALHSTRSTKELGDQRQSEHACYCY
jgi:hypothetical protein